MGKILKDYLFNVRNNLIYSPTQTNNSTQNKMKFPFNQFHAKDIYILYILLYLHIRL